MKIEMDGKMSLGCVGDDGEVVVQFAGKSPQVLSELKAFKFNLLWFRRGL